MRKARAAFVALAAGLMAPSAQAAEAGSGYQLVVNAANPLAVVARGDVTQIFLKKTLTWPNGQPAVPVDQRSDAPSRQAFSMSVLRKDPNEIASYWNQMIFSGRALPPPTKGSDDEVLAFVRANPNAIGYIGGATAVGEGVKVVKVQD
jgi:ABC-type phosphate transport system substrate-binding protein